MPEPLTLTAPTITAATRLARLLTVNALAVAVLSDTRDAAPLTAQQPAPNATPRVRPAAVTTDEYLTAYRRWVDCTMAEHAAQDDPERHAAAIIATARAERDMHALEALLREEAAPRIRPGHPTRYRVTVPAACYVHPDPRIGIHARSEGWRLIIDTAGLEGEDLATFKTFQLTFPARGQWPLYAPHRRDGLQRVGNHPQADAARELFGALVSAGASFLPLPVPVSNDVALSL